MLSNANVIFAATLTLSVLVQAVVAGCALVKNAALHRALRRKDNEMNQLILMVRPPHMRMHLVEATRTCVLSPYIFLWGGT